MELHNKQLGSYQLLALIGKGGMAEVWSGTQLSLNREVAIKVIPNKKDELRLAERFEREAHAVAQLDHPAILPVIDYGSTDEYLYLIMPYVRGGSLLERIRREPLSRMQALRIFEQTLSGLSYAHRQGIIHRDLKPGNILLYQDNRAVIADFGVAKTLKEDVSLTQTGVAVGSPEYMAPEQFMGQTTVRTDLYSMGVILYQLLTGRPLYSGTTSWEIAMRHMNDPLPLPHPLIPLPLEQFLNKALQKRPEARFASAEDMEAGLHQAIIHLSQAELDFHPAMSSRPGATPQGALQLPTTPLRVSQPDVRPIPPQTPLPVAQSLPQPAPLAPALAKKPAFKLPLIGLGVLGLMLISVGILFFVLNSGVKTGNSTTISPAAVAPALTADSSRPSFRVMINPQNGTKVSGIGLITDNGNNSVTVTLEISGLKPGDHHSHIHQGTCLNQGAIKFPLNDLRTTSDGKATSTTIVSASLAAITGGGLYLNVHNQAGTPTYVAGCAEIAA